jgi:4-amino-4-deoxy-L-arabinose transferase-like glycosyltransferase
VLFLYNLWRWTRDRKGFSLAWSGLCLGLALATKFSAVILLPVALVLILATMERKKGALDRLAGAVAGLAILAGLVIWAAYLFPSDLSFYLDGMSRVNADHDPNRAYYLMGDFQVGGYPHYFLMAFLFKTPLPTLLLLGAAVVLMRRFKPNRGTDELFLILPVLAFFIVTSALADGIGLRYLLPIYPLLFIFISRLAAARPSGHLLRLAGAALLLWYAASAAWIFPHHLAYFNEAAGGPANGYKLLGDSNLDWGQDLPLLKRWQEETGTGTVRLLFSWNGRPENYGIDHVRATPRDWYDKPTPGTYVVSTFWLVRGLHEHRTKDVPTNWLEIYEPVDRIGYSFFVYRFGDD